MSGAVCDHNANCKVNKKRGNEVHKQCRCKPGFKGNGVTCRDSNGNIPTPPDNIVEVLIEMRGDVYTYPHQAGNYTAGPEMDALLAEMENTAKVCTNKAGCQASFQESIQET